MIPKAFDQIEEQDLQSLIDIGVLEGKTIEYKQNLTMSNDKDKKEFLADVSSFANASGGDLIYGIVEDRSTGAPESLEGLLIQNEDELIRKLEAQIRDGIEPRIPSVNIRAIPLSTRCEITWFNFDTVLKLFHALLHDFVWIKKCIPQVISFQLLSNTKTALIIRVLKSWVSPHRVVSGGHDKFYSRNTKGKYPLDVGELRIAFNLSNSITERIRKFRENRISEIYANEAPVPLNENAKIILHLIPISSISSEQTYDMSKLPFDPRLMTPFSTMSWNHRYNLDGYLTYSMYRDVVSHYVQLYRNGIIEAVESSLLGRSDLKIPSIAFEEVIMNAFNNYISNLKALDVGLPIFAFLTFVGVKGYSMTREPIGIEDDTIEKDILLIPEIVIESFDFEVNKILKPWFDAVWNACGFPRSLNYDEYGKWKP